MTRSRATLLVALLALSVTGAANAQDAGDKIETVIVTGQRVPTTPEGIAHAVINSVATPSLLLGTIGRWQGGLCPRTDGLSSRTMNDFVTRRIRELAKEVGAPLADEPCRSNIEVVFSDDPQAVLDSVRQTHSTILGYHPASKITHPIQAWYMTGTVDVRGKLEVDHDVLGNVEYANGGPQIDSKTGANIGFVEAIGIPEASIVGWKGKPEVSSDILAAFIIADTRATGNHALGPVADYLAMLALSHTEAHDQCQIVPTILNLMATNCAGAVAAEAITASDLGYLRGVYRMDPGASLQVQRDQIAGEMAKTIQVKEGP